MEQQSIAPCIIDLPEFVDARGSLSFVEEGRHIPFTIAHSRWISDVSAGAMIGEDEVPLAHDEFIVALHGSFEVELEADGKGTHYFLNSPAHGLHALRGYRRVMRNFSADSVALLLSSPIGEEKHGYPCGIKGETSKVSDCSIINMGTRTCGSARMTEVANELTVPFTVRRAFYLYNISDGSDRGEHAHRETYQFLIAANGSFNVTLDDGTTKQTFKLERPDQGLLVVPGIWNTLSDFTPGSVCLVLTSHGYDAADYIRDYQQFIHYK